MLCNYIKLYYNRDTACSNLKRIHVTHYPCKFEHQPTNIKQLNYLEQYCQTQLACDSGRLFSDSAKRKNTQNIIWRVLEESGEFQRSLASGEYDRRFSKSYSFQQWLGKTRLDSGVRKVSDNTDLEFHRAENFQGLKVSCHSANLRMIWKM
jgi:hypothetical protein